MSRQLELGLAEKAPKVSPEEIAEFCQALRRASLEYPSRKGWHTSAQLGAKTNQQKRRMRAIAQASNGRVISFQGSPGYKLFDECVPEEFAHADRARSSAIREQTLTLVAIRRRMHERGVVFPSNYQAEPIE